MNKVHLSKSRYCKVVQCEKIIWLNKPVHNVLESGDIVFDFATDYNDWRGALESAGVDFIAPKNCAVYADNRVVSIYPREDVEFEIDTKGKTYVSVRDGKTIKGKQMLKIKAKSGVAFEIVE